MDIVSYILSKKYIEDSLAGAGALAGKSAYEIAQDNGFAGTPAEWLASLRGDTPEIGPNGTWIIGENDTGVVASPSLAGYATQEYVNTQIAAIDFPEPDLSPYATRKELNEAILGIVIPDVSGFATKEELDAAIKAIPAPDLTSYATKEELEQAIASIPKVDLAGYATEQFVKNEIEKIPEVDLSDYATKEELPSIAGLATEEFVRQKIAEAELGESEVDLSAYYTKSEVDEKFENIEHPVTDLAGYATEEYVRDVIAAIPQPDLSGYATDEELLEAISNIEIPSVDGLASEEYVREQIAEIAIPDTTGLATESYVDEAIAAIVIPDAKADVNVYEIVSDSVVLDELIALLPEGVKINQGDVMLVTNTLGVKSAYQFDETWIACDGNVDASKVIMPFDITLAGSYTQVGNLTKTSTGTGTFTTKGKSVAQALQEILSKREQPKIKTQPSVSLTASSGAKEVGTKITPEWSASLNAGAYTYGPATGVTASSWEISDTNGNKASTASGEFAEITVGDSTNYRITAKANYAAGAVAVDNLGDPSSPTIQIAAGSKSANGGYITGYRAWFMYVGESLDTIDSAFIRGTSNMGSTPTTQSGINIPAGTKRVMIAIPATSNLALKQVIDVDGMGLDVFGNFTPTTIDVEGLNGYTAKAYNVWIAENINGMAATHYNLVIG